MHLLFVVFSVVVHFGVSCDSCGYVDIRGNRYKCTICYNYDLCETCYNSNKHNLGHGFRRFDSPHSTG